MLVLEKMYVMRIVRAVVKSIIGGMCMPNYLAIMLAAGQQGLLVVTTDPAALFEAEAQRRADLELLDHLIEEELREASEFLPLVYDRSRGLVLEEVAARDISQVQLPIWQQLNQPTFGPPRMRGANGPVHNHHGKRPSWRR